jgi:hypothetical protein
MVGGQAHGNNTGGEDIDVQRRWHVTILLVKGAGRDGWGHTGTLAPMAAHKKIHTPDSAMLVHTDHHHTWPIFIRSQSGRRNAGGPDTGPPSHLSSETLVLRGSNVAFWVAASIQS